jgi:hypothetical protein
MEQMHTHKDSRSTQHLPREPKSKHDSSHLQKEKMNESGPPTESAHFELSVLYFAWHIPIPNLE